MKKAIRTILIFGVCAVGSSQFVRAEMLNGSFTNHFNDPLCLWDPSGTYSDDLPGFDGMTTYYSMNADADGKLSGSGGFEYDDGWDYLSGDFSLSGTIKGSGELVRVSLAISMNGGGSIYDYDVDFTAKIKQILEIDSASREMLGTMSGKMTLGIPSLGKKKTQSIPKSEVELALPEDAGGAWMLSVDLAPSGKTYSGLGVVELSNGRSFSLAVAGSYSDKKDSSRLLLDGSQFLMDRLSKAVKFTVVAAGTNGTLTIQSLKGNILGQKPQVKN